MSRKRWKLDGWTLVSLLCFLYFAVFFIYPITRILISSVYDAATNTFDFSYFIKFFSKKYYTNTIINSLKVTVLATVFTCVAGTALAYVTRTVKIKYPADHLCRVSAVYRRLFLDHSAGTAGRSDQNNQSGISYYLSGNLRIRGNPACLYN